MSVETVVVSGSSSPKEEKPTADLALFLGELKGLMSGISESLATMNQKLSEVHTQTSEILSLAETIEEVTEETAETVEEVAEAVEEAESESEEEENLSPQVEVEITPAPPIMTDNPPEKPESKMVSTAKRFLLG